jgi:hypothetical protein
MFDGTLSIISTIGSLELLRLKLITLFCSQNVLTMQYLMRTIWLTSFVPRTTVISGFHTSVEKDMLDILIKGKGPIVICLARGLEGVRISGRLQKRLDEGTMIICSIANLKNKRITSETSVERNKLVAALAVNHIFIHIESRGLLAGLYNKLMTTEQSTQNGIL